MMSTTFVCLRGEAVREAQAHRHDGCILGLIGRQELKVARSLLNGPPRKSCSLRPGQGSSPARAPERSKPTKAAAAERDSARA